MDAQRGRGGAHTPTGHFFIAAAFLLFAKGKELLKLLMIFDKAELKSSAEGKHLQSNCYLLGIWHSLATWPTIHPKDTFHHFSTTYTGPFAGERPREIIIRPPVQLCKL